MKTFLCLRTRNKEAAVMQNTRVCAYINKEAIIHNFNIIKDSLPDNVKVMSVIKADAYGHGAEVFAKCIGEKSDYLAVAIIEEALEIRKSGVNAPILVLGHSFPNDFKAALENDITLTMLSFEEAEVLSSVAKETGKTAKVHIPVDTGMGRIGVRPTREGAEEVKRISFLENIYVEGIFTHFSTADEIDKEFTLLQAERFSSFKEMLSELGLNIPVFHCANSGAIMQHRDFLFDMVRPGIILYGLNPSGEVSQDAFDFKPVMSLESVVAFVKTVEKGESIGYGRTFIAEKTMKIATIPVGYADGYPRLLSNKGRVIINGKYAPITGRICMDQFMVDVSHIEDIKVGDKVILMGREGKLFISADEIAKHSQTINYEIVCGISKRVPRVVR